MLKVKDKYLYEDGKPFFWLGDTAWLIAENLHDFNEVENYLLNRKMLGFNVIQFVLFYTLPDKEKIQSGMPTGNKNIFSEEYFQFVDRIISYAEKLGIYSALLPCWGSYVKNKVLTLDTLDAFTEFLTKRYSKHEKLVWVLGGDVKGSENIELFNEFGKLLKNKDKNHLITFHPFGRTLSARWFNDESWLDFNMFQSGHRRYDQARLKAWDDVEKNFYGEDNWLYVEENDRFSFVKPCLDAEPSYEGIPQGLHDPKEPYWEAKDVRRYAYWSLFAGACGFTYGNNAIIQFYDESLGKGAYGVRENWKSALHSEGGAELQFLKKLFESVDFTSGTARQDYLASKQGEKYDRVSIFAGKSFLFAYSYLGKPFTLTLKDYENKKMDAFYCNPQNGTMSFIETIVGVKEKTFTPTKRYEDSNDWVLVLKEKE